jgi:hypothetical protein
VSFHQSSKIVSSYILHFGNICKSSLAIISEFPISLRKLTKVHVQPIIDCIGLCTFLFILIKLYSGGPQLYLMLKKSCPHCDQAEESIKNLLLSCVFARKFWFKLLQRVGLQFLAPQIGEEFFDDWWALGKNQFEGWVSLQKGLSSLVILGMWTLWIHRNKSQVCVW